MATKAAVQFLTSRNSIYINWGSFTADGDIGGGQNGTDTRVDLTAIGIDFLPYRWTMHTKLTAGSTDGVDIALQGSDDNATWADIVDITAATTDPHDETDTGVFAYRYIRILVTTVGAGNTIDVNVIGVI